MTKHLLQIYQILFEEFGPQHWWPAETRDEVIIGAVLTQNTNWTNVEKAIANLKAQKLLSLAALAKSKADQVAKCIRPSGYYNQKAERLILVSKALAGYQTPESQAEFRAFLLSLKGIGPETADSILLYAYKIPVFVVDAYTKRIFSRLGLCRADSRYNEVQNLFMNHLQRDAQLYNEYHALLVRLAKLSCRKQPICQTCPVQELCSYAINFTSETL